MSPIAFQVDAAGIALITIDVSDRSMNVFTTELEEALSEAVSRVSSDTSIKGAVITSGKQNGFMAGADLKEIVKACGRDSAEEAYERSQRMSGLFRRLETCGKPVAAAINGLALGGGLELALSCHYRVVIDDPKAVVGLPEVKVGLLPGAGGTQRLPRLIGIPNALSLLLSGDSLTPHQALTLGVVDAVVPAEALIDVAREWALQHPQAVAPWDVKGFTVPGGAGCLAAHAIESFQVGASRLMKKTQKKYPAPPAILSCVFEGTQLAIDVGLRIESKYFAKLLSDTVSRNLVRTLFISRGSAEKLARRPKGIAKSEVRRLGVVGAGLMGSGISYAAAVAGIEVALLDETVEKAQAGKSHAFSAGRRQLDGQNAEAAVSRIKPTTRYEDLRECDLVIEAVFESRDIKREVFSRVAGVLPRDSVLASNTSTLPITTLAGASMRPDRFIGIHFFSPVERMALVEIIVGKETTQEALAKAMDFVAQLRKTAIVVNDGPGFYTSRVFSAFVDEGMAMLNEGVGPVLIENAARRAGMPVGPLAVTDEVSIELQLRVHQQAVADDLPARFQRLTAIGVIKKMVEMSRCGRRSGGGFYEYPAGAQKRIWPGLCNLFPVSARQPSIDDLEFRLLSIQALEAARCWEEGVVGDPADADLGAVLGFGYPSWTGGPLSYIDMVGPKAIVERCERLASEYGERFMPPSDLRRRALSGATYYAT